MLHADSAELSTGQTQVKPPSQQIPALPSSDALTILVAARCYIKMDTVVAVACLHILFVIPGAFTQGNTDQRDSVRDLRNNRNMEIVVTCPLVEANILSCNLQQENPLMSEDGVYLQQLNIVINTCNASLSPSFIFSNNIMRRKDGLRCTTKIPLGQFSVMFDLNIFLNQTNNFTVITTMISAWKGGEDIELFRKTNLVLSGQFPLEDCIAEGGLVRPPIQCSTSAGVILSSFSAVMFIAVAVALVHILT